MTITTNAISIFINCQPGNSAYLHGGLSVQILPSIHHLSGCLKHQFAAFIRDRQMLIVWCDEPEKVIEHMARIELMLVETIWNDGQSSVDEKDAKVERIDEVANLEESGIGLG